MLLEKDQRLPRQGIEAILAVFHLHEELLTHAARPVTFDVFGDTGDRILAPWLGAKEIADVVRHVDQVLCAAHVRIIGFGPMAHGLSHAATHPARSPTGRLRSRISRCWRAAGAPR